VTWAVTLSGYDLLFNRDEQRTRVRAEPPAVRAAADGARFLAPLDPQGGGSWIAVSDHGLTTCLLNSCEPDRPLASDPGPASHPLAPEAAVSRGRLPFILADCRCPADVALRLEKEDLARYRPFLLLALAAGAGGPAAWHWSGTRLAHRPAPAAPLTTTSRHVREVVRIRREAFARLRRGLPAGADPGVDALFAYHTSENRERPEAGVAMRRDDAQTVSLTHVRVSLDTGVATMRYFDGHPADSTVTDSAVEASLDLGIPASPEPLPGARPPDGVPAALDPGQWMSEKNPGLAARIPRPVFGILDAVIHRRRIDRMLTDLRGLPARDFPRAILSELDVQWEVVGESPPPASERPVFVVNHPLGAIDGLGMLAWALDRYRDVRLAANDVLMGIPHLRPFLIPLDRYRGRLAGVRSLHGHFAGDAPIVVFPAGRTARPAAGRLVDHPWQPMAAGLAHRYDRSVVPVFITARNSRRFYRVAALRARLGIDLNLEMLLLPDEMFRATGSRVEVRMGRAVRPAELVQLGRTDRERVDALHRLCHALS